MARFGFEWQIDPMATDVPITTGPLTIEGESVHDEGHGYHTVRCNAADFVAFMNAHQDNDRNGEYGARLTAQVPTLDTPALDIDCYYGDPQQFPVEADGTVTIPNLLVRVAE